MSEQEKSKEDEVGSEEITDETRRVYRCMYCKKTFTTLYMCREHIKLAHGQREDVSLDKNVEELCYEPHNTGDHSSYCDKPKGHEGISKHRCHYCHAYY